MIVHARLGSIESKPINPNLNSNFISDYVLVYAFQSHFMADLADVVQNFNKDV